MSEDFAAWITTLREERGWSHSEAARRGGFSASMFDKVVAGQAQPGLDFCRGIAQAFGIPLVEVFRRAHILPAAGDLAGQDELAACYQGMSARNRRRLLEIARILYRESGED